MIVAVTKKDQEIREYWRMHKKGVLTKEQFWMLIHLVTEREVVCQTN